MVPGIPDFMLDGGQGGMTIAPSSGATSSGRSGDSNNELNFGGSGSFGLGAGHMLVIGGVVLAAVFLVTRS